MKKFFILLITIFLITITSCTLYPDTSSGSNKPGNDNNPGIDDPSGDINNPSDDNPTNNNNQTPIIDQIDKITGLDNIEISKGQYFNPYKDVKVTSTTGEDITRYLNVTGHVNYGVIGEYDLEYSITYGESTEIINRTITVTNKSISRTTYSYNGINETVNVGSASYRSGNGTELDSPSDPIYLENDLRNKPVPTSSWWTTMLRDNYGASNGIFTNPYRASFQADGVEITDCGEGFTQYWTDADSTVSTAQFFNAIKEVMFKASSLSSSYYTRVIDYSDTTAKIALRNSMEGADEMVVTFVQGSPYIFVEQKEKTGNFSLAVAGATKPYEFYDLEGNKVTNTYTGNALIIKIPQMHVGYTCAVPNTPNSTLPQNPIYEDKYYLINAPENTTFTFSKVKHSNEAFTENIAYTLGEGNYFTIGSLNNIQEASFYHEHAYSFVHRGTVDYNVDYSTSIITTEYTHNYSNINIESNPIFALLPHQYKYSDATLTSYIFESVRGNLKVYNGSSFETKQSFYGMLPGYTSPTDNGFNESLMNSYLASLDSNTNTTYGDNDENRAGPYWDSKTIYPLAQGLLMADQLYNVNYKNSYLTKIEELLIDWFTYSGQKDKKYLYYNEKYGTMYYSNNDFNTATSLNDHHFTHGYLVFAASIASMYDDTFYQNYKEIIDLLLQDYACPTRDSDLYPYLRTFDKWQGHSWADGFGSAAEGNNQESSGEALNSWVAAYLYGLQTQNQEMIDAAIYGFTTELNSIKQYVFNYDNDLWSDEYRSQTDVCCITWGGKNTDATFFGLNPSFVYGIHWLPIGEYVSSYAITASDKEALQRIYNNYLERKTGFKDTWMSNMRCIEAILNPNVAISNFNDLAILADDYPNDLAPTYYNIYALKSLGQKTDEIKVGNATNVAWSVYKYNNTTYNVQLWNPTSSAQKVNIIDSTGNVIKTVTINANSFENFSINK